MITQRGWGNPQPGELVTPQERLWAGKFGDEYQSRSPGKVGANFVLFEHALRGLPIDSVIEFGAGAGANLQALRILLPKAHLSAVEINRVAVEALFEHKVNHGAHVHIGSVLRWKHPGLGEPAVWDLAFTKGLLIHIHPEDLPAAYDTLYRASRRYILVAEYYNPTPIAIPYRGQENALWKRDFAGELMGRFPDLHLLDYGFVYHRDPYPQDDLTWFLLERRVDRVERHP